MVMVCGVSQFSVVKVMDLRATVPSVLSELLIARVTADAGRVSSVTVKLAVFPFSAVMSPEFGAAVISGVGARKSATTETCAAAVLPLPA